MLRLFNLVMWLLAIAFIVVFLAAPDWLERAVAWAGLS